MRILSLLVLSLAAAACSPQPLNIDPTEHYEGRYWGNDSVTLLIDSTLPECTQNHAMASLFAWVALAAHDADLEVHQLDPALDPSLFADDGPIQGVIVVKAGSVSDDTVAHTYYWALDSRIVGANITLGNTECSRAGLRTVLHEMGHAFGLPDMYRPQDQENVMWFRNDGGFSIRDWQLHIVRFGLVVPLETALPRILVPRGAFVDPRPGKE